MSSLYIAQFTTDLVLKSVRDSLIDTPTYVYLADGVSNNTVAEVIEDTSKTISDASNSILAGKRVVEEDVYYLILKRPWVQGTVYTQYDDRADMRGANFFVLAANRAVYKCISNNYGAPSTVQPTSLDTFSVKYSDGYIWKFMYRLTNSQINRYQVSGTIPLVPDQDVIDAAVPGSIDRVQVTSKGTNYTAVHQGQFLEVVSNTVLRIDDAASTISSIYKDSSIYVVSGSGSGQLARIADYTSNSSGKFVTTSSPLTGVGLDAVFDIAPTIECVGDGFDFKARSIVEDGQLVDVEVLEIGNHYSFANLNVVASSGNGAGASCRAVISPRTGHGSNPAAELYSNSLVVNTKFDDQDENIPYGISFSQFGLARNFKTAANTLVVFDDNSFNGITNITINYLNGTFKKGDVVTSSGSTAHVVSANGASAGVIFTSPRYSFGVANTIANQSGVQGTIVSIDESDIYTGDVEVLSTDTINTVTRTNMSDETINIVLRV